jgi:hypothetical protein
MPELMSDAELAELEKWFMCGTLTQREQQRYGGQLIAEVRRCWEEIEQLRVAHLGQVDAVDYALERGKGLCDSGDTNRHRHTGIR